MKFSVVYSVDTPKGVSLKRFYPPEVKQLWTQTEGDDCYELAGLGGKYTSGSHRKWIGLIDKIILKDLVMGTPGFDSFEGEGVIMGPAGWDEVVLVSSLNLSEDYYWSTDGVLLQAMVTPVLEGPNGRYVPSGRDWIRAKWALIDLLNLNNHSAMSRADEMMEVA